MTIPNLVLNMKIVIYFSNDTPSVLSEIIEISNFILQTLMNVLVSLAKMVAPAMI